MVFLRSRIKKSRLNINESGKMNLLRLILFLVPAASFIYPIDAMKLTNKKKRTRENAQLRQELICDDNSFPNKSVKDFFSESKNESTSWQELEQWLYEDQQGEYFQKSLAAYNTTIDTPTTMHTTPSESLHPEIALQNEKLVEISNYLSTFNQQINQNSSRITNLEKLIIEVQLKMSNFESKLAQCNNNVETLLAAYRPISHSRENRKHLADYPPKPPK